MYERGKIYKITCGDLTYYGSTCNTLTKRLNSHKSDFKMWQNDKKKYFTSYKLFEIGKPIITLVEDMKCERKEQLLSRERWYIDNNVCVNKVSPIMTRKETKQKYTDNHKEEIKAYDYSRKDVKAACYKDNREKINAQRAKPWKCECCDVTIKLVSKSYHIKTAKHLLILKSNVIINVS